MSITFSYLQSFQHDAILKQQKSQGSDLVMRSSHANVQMVAIEVFTETLPLGHQVDYHG